MKWSLRDICLMICVGIQIQNIQGSELWSKCRRAVVGALDLTVEERAIVTSRDNQVRPVVLTYGVHDAGVKKAKALRIDDDTVVVIRADCSDGLQKVFVSVASQHVYARQLYDIQQFVNQCDLQDATMKAVVLAALRDRDRELPASPIFYDEHRKVHYWPHNQNFWETYQSMLGALDINARIVDYTMVPGDAYRDRYHFEVEVGKRGVVWRSATHGLTDCTL